MLISQGATRVGQPADQVDSPNRCHTALGWPEEDLAAHAAGWASPKGQDKEAWGHVKMADQTQAQRSQTSAIDCGWGFIWFMLLFPPGSSLSALFSWHAGFPNPIIISGVQPSAPCPVASVGIARQRATRCAQERWLTSADTPMRISMNGHITPQLILNGAFAPTMTKGKSPLQQPLDPWPGSRSGRQPCTYGHHTAPSTQE